LEKGSRNKEVMGMEGQVARTILLFKKNVVGGFAVERRVQVDQINRFSRDLSAEDIQVVTVVESVHISSRAKKMRR